jgi:integrase
MSIRKVKKTGKYQVMYRDSQGRQRAKNFTLKKDAETYEREVKLSIERGTYTDPSKGKTSLKEIYLEWMKTKESLTPKSKAWYESLWNTHLEQAFGNSPLKTITAPSINKWALSRATGDSAVASSARIAKAQTLLAALLDYSVDLGLIPRNPARKSNGKVNKLRVGRKANKRPATALNLDELLQLAEKVGKYKALILVMGLSGLRWGEAIALRPCDINLEKKLLIVTRSISELKGNFSIQDTKTHVARSLILPELVLEEFRKLMLGMNPEDLFFTKNGTYLPNTHFRKVIYDPAVRATGLPPITIHDLRHTSASIAIANGANILVLARILGHSTPTMTLNVYGHMFKEDLESVTETLDSVIKNQRINRLTTSNNFI